MRLAIYEELYQTPLKFDFELPCCAKVDCKELPNCNGKYKSNGNSNDYLLQNHQSRTAISKITKISQEGLEMRAQHQEAKRIKLKNEMLISSFLKIPVQSKRSKRHRGKKKYLNHMYIH